jgi:hypothetical protein
MSESFEGALAQENRSPKTAYSYPLGVRLFREFVGAMLCFRQ